MKKIIVNIILLVCTLGLGYACYQSIYSDIEFDAEKATNEKLVKARLMQIRDAEDLYKKTFGDYCGTMDSLIDFVKNGKAVYKIEKEGDFNDELAERFGGSEAAAARAGAIRRDTIWKSTLEILNEISAHPITCADSLKFVPVGRKFDPSKYTVYEFHMVGSQAQDSVANDTVYEGVIELRKSVQYDMKSEQFVSLVEFRARLEDYLDGFNEKKVKTYKNELKKRGLNASELMCGSDEVGDWYGLRMGDITDINNKMTGNWDE